MKLVIIAFIIYLFIRITSLSLSYVITDEMCEKKIKRMRENKVSDIDIELTKVDYKIKQYTFTFIVDVITVMILFGWLGGWT